MDLAGGGHIDNLTIACREDFDPLRAASSSPGNQATVRGIMRGDSGAVDELYSANPGESRFGRRRQVMALSSRHHCVPKMKATEMRLGDRGVTKHCKNVSRLTGSVQRPGVGNHCGQCRTQQTLFIDQCCISLAEPSEHTAWMSLRASLVHQVLCTSKSAMDGTLRPLHPILRAQVETQGRKCVLWQLHHVVGERVSKSLFLMGYLPKSQLSANL